MKRIIYLVLVLILTAGCANREAQTPESSAQQIEEENNKEAIVQETNPEEVEQVKQASTWRDGGVAISGKYADAEIIDIDNSKYRMYYSPEPEASGFKGQVYSAISSDGITWDKEAGERLEWATFPSLIKLTDGKYRMYFQNQGFIKSAISMDGLSWNEELGTRVTTSNNAGLKLENVAAPTVMKIGSEYVMVYRGTINEKYPAKVPNDNTQLFLWATSKDGLAFEERGIALDSRNEEFQGLLDGPEFVVWDDGSVRLYFWSYKGVYYTTFSNNEFSKESVFSFTTSSTSNRFPENPPGDPALVKIHGKWFRYYGQHGKGIFYATLEG